MVKSDDPLMTFSNRIFPQQFKARHWRSHLKAATQDPFPQRLRPLQITQRIWSTRVTWGQLKAGTCQSGTVRVQQTQPAKPLRERKDPFTLFHMMHLLSVLQKGSSFASISSRLPSAGILLKAWPELVQRWFQLPRRQRNQEMFSRV